MRKSLFLISAVALVLALAAQGDGLAGSQTRKLQVAQPQTQAPVHKMGAITRNQLLQQVNKSVQIEGFFYNGSIPMVIDNIERVKIDMMLPPDSYVPIVGPLPSGLRSGDRIVIQGTIQRPTAQDPAGVRRESLIIKVAAAKDISRLKVSVARLEGRVISAGRIRFAGQVTVLPRQVKYAVLIAGGGDPANNHRRYWNDLKTMYAILTANGYNAANIYVLYADGTARDAGMPVNYSASKANIATVFNLLASKMTGFDKLYIMLNDHGGGLMTTATGGYPAGLYGGFNDTNGDETGEAYNEATYNIDMTGDGDKNDSFKVDETLSLWGEKISDEEFAAEVNKIGNYATMIIQMKQCFCGGFTADMTRTNRIIMASASPEQVSWAHSSLDFGEFTYWYFAALTGNKPDGGGAVNADANGDGKISILEAYNFARANDGRTETPFYEDNGIKPSHSGAVPNGGDGTLGSTTFL
jgi:hypothetical protein